MVKSEAETGETALRKASLIWMSTRIDESWQRGNSKSSISDKVGLMHDPTTSRDLRDNGSVLTKNRMASAGGGNREI